MVKKCSSPDSVVATKHKEMPNQRCQAQLQKMQIPEENDECSIYGGITLDKKSKDHCIGFIRGFVQFLLDHKGCDDSLVAFCPKTKKGSVTVSAEAASLYLIN